MFPKTFCHLTTDRTAHILYPEKSMDGKYVLLHFVGGGGMRVLFI